MIAAQTGTREIVYCDDDDLLLCKAGIDNDI